MKIKAKIIIFIAPELIIFKCAVAETETLFLSVDFIAWMQQLHDSIVVSIPACHAGDRGSIPRRGAFFILYWSHEETGFTLF